MMAAAGFLVTSALAAPRAANEDAGKAGADRRAALLEERLDAGEFGPALDAAGEIDDLTARVREFRQISAAQQRSGDFSGAAATARRIPETADRSRALGAAVRGQNHAGGGSMANFKPLIELITSTIQPDTWDEVGGPGSVKEYRSGVHVDPQGMMRQLTKQEQTGQLENLSRRARIADLNDDLAREAPLRLVSLRRLEAAVASRIETGRPIPETLRHLAGLTQIKYVFAYPAEREIVIAGPAEGWRYDDLGRAVGRESGHPLLELDDLVVVLRAFSPAERGVFGCSINTRDANLKDLKDFVEESNQRGALRPGQLGPWLAELARRLGQQDVVVDGIPADTRVAQVLVEADYKMKLIGVEKYNGGPGIPGYFKLLQQAGQVRGAPLEALRWWLTMKYDAILHSPDRLAFELSGSSVLVQSENQFVNAHGKHVPTGVSEPINRKFAENFTEHYAELAARDPVFADLQNIFDLALVAALCRQEHLFDKADWNLGVFAAGGAYQPAVVPAARVIDSVLAHRVYGGSNIVVQVAGGVEANLAAIASDKSLARESADLPYQTNLPAERWWWDGEAR